MPQAESVMSWVHFGDLHLTREGEQNHRDFLALIDAANRHLAGRVNFAVLPGDNADDGTEAQFHLVCAAIERLAIPLHILPGDHDFHTRSLEAFYAVLAAARLPKAVVVAGHRCLFLDIVSAGSGGPDFRLDDAQLDWLQAELERADADGERPAVFMHAYPADLRAGAERLRSLLARYRVPCVDMGHTHYNELANDGRTIYAATRSTGQIEEGPVGFSLMAIDHGVVSWRFKTLRQVWPFVLITSPADMRLVIDPQARNQVPNGLFDVRAKAWSGKGITSAACRINDGPWYPMVSDPSDPSLWQCACPAPDVTFALIVRVEDASGDSDQETIRVAAGHYDAPQRHGNGSDADAIGAWFEKGILGSQLGPNRNGRKW
jgi:3',5'-cyclic-AMP phosphodiesterase